MLVDRGWPPYPGSGFQPYGYVSPYATTASLDTTEATAEQSTGLATITSEVEFGAVEAAGTRHRHRQRRVGCHQPPSRGGRHRLSR